MVLSSCYPLTRFDPETVKYYDFPEAAHTYSLAFDKDENVWFTNPGTGQIGKVDAKTLKVKQWMPPTLNTYERRIAVDSDGRVWLGEFKKGNIGRFDPKT
jgi:virginiamycin B lyase